jgi:hypothetical protein
MDLDWVPPSLSADRRALRRSCPGYPERDRRAVGSGLLACDQVACPEQATFEGRVERHDTPKIGDARTVVKPDQCLGRGVSVGLDTESCRPDVSLVMSNRLQSIRLLARSGSLQAGS